MEATVQGLGCVIDDTHMENSIENEMETTTYTGGIYDPNDGESNGNKMKSEVETGIMQTLTCKSSCLSEERRNHL